MTAPRGSLRSLSSQGAADVVVLGFGPVSKLALTAMGSGKLIGKNIFAKKLTVESMG